MSNIFSVLSSAYVAVSLRRKLKMLLCFWRADLMLLLSYRTAINLNFILMISLPSTILSACFFRYLHIMGIFRLRVTFWGLNDLGVTFNSKFHFGFAIMC